MKKFYSEVTLIAHTRTFFPFREEGFFVPFFNWQESA
jgi:hypothetical protein